MSIFETHVKDVVQRTDSDPLALVSRFETVDSASADASLGGVVLVDDDTAGEAVTVTLPENAPPNGKVTVKKLGTTANVSIEAAAEGDSIEDGTVEMTAQYDHVTLISDGSSYYVVSSDYSAP